MASDPRGILTRWYDEMWAKKAFHLVPEIAGPTYVRHEMGGTREISAEDYRDQLLASAQDWEISDFTYRLITEGDFATAIGSWKVNGKQWDWVQAFRVADGKIVETWLSGIGFESTWGDGVIPS